MLLFSYGTLQQAHVQHALFGRALRGTADALTGWRLDRVAIPDPDAVALSGIAVHLILRPDANAPTIHGQALEIEPADLVPADAYEGATYVRTEVRLASGRAAWVYVAA